MRLHFLKFSVLTLVFKFSVLCAHAPQGASFLSCLQLLGARPIGNDIREHAVLIPITDSTHLFEIHADARTRSLKASDLRTENSPVLRRSISLREVTFPNFRVKIMSPVTLSGLSTHFNQALGTKSTGGTLNHAGLSPIDELLRAGTASPEQLREADAMVEQLLRDHYARYLEEEQKAVRIASTDMELRRGWNTQALQDLVEKYIQRSINIEIQDPMGETLITFRIIMAPYGYKEVQARPAFGEKGGRLFGSFGPSVITQWLSAEERALYVKWLASKQPTAHQPLSVELYGDDYLSERQAKAFALFERLESENKSQTPTLLMMEEIIPKETLARLFPGTGLLPRDGDPYRWDAKNSQSFHSGIVQEWGKFRVKKGTEPEIFIEGLAHALSVLFDDRLNPFYALSAQRVYTYGNRSTLLIDSAFGFHKASEQSFQNPFAQSNEPWWILSATPMEIVQAVLGYKNESRLAQKEALNQALSHFLSENELNSSSFPFFGSTSTNRAP